MKLRVIKEDAISVTLGWDPVPGAEGWLFYLNGKRVSKSFDVNKRTVKFSKPGVYRVQAVTFAVVDQDTYPDDPPPPQTYVKVAPRATNMEGGSNVQYCMFNDDGSLRPGVRSLGGDTFTDESGAIYTESKQDTSIRDESYYVDGLPGSRSMDGRSPCQCLKDGGSPGDPTKNTGAWHI